MITTLIFQRKLPPLLPVMLVFLWGCKGPHATSPCDDPDVLVKSCFCEDASLVPLGPRTFPDLQLADHNWIAAVAQVNGYAQIYLIDYDDPAIYKRITNDEEYYNNPTFSPDRSFLIFLGGGGWTDNSLLWRYDVAEDTTYNLPVEDFISPHVIGSDPIVITPAGSRVYYRWASSWGTCAYYYEFATQVQKPFYNSGILYVDGHLNGDSLIVVGGGFDYTGQPFGYYTVNIAAEYLCFLNNPHLEQVRRDDGLVFHGIWNREWNAELGQVVFAENDTTYPGRKIGISNLDGSFYETYTSGDFHDDNPSWGPDGEFIMFDRTHPGPPYTGPYTVMVLNVLTGDVIQFVKPEVIDGATSLSQPDY